VPDRPTGPRSVGCADKENQYMPSTEWSALRDTFAACASKTMATFMAAVTAANPGIDMRGIDGIYRLATEPTDVTYEEVAAAGLSAIWANPAGCDTERALIYFHGGGFVSGSKDSHRKVAAHLAKAAGCRALIPDYRLAPEHPFPAQLDDARSLYDWLLTQGYQPSKIAFAGDSAGGNLATGAALALKRDNRPLPGAVVAFSPWYDMEANGATFESNAATDMAISRELVHNTAPMFLGGHSPTDPLANPLYSDPTGLPPIFLTCGSHETLQDNVERFAAQAQRTGVDAVLQIEEGMPHVYQLMAGRVPEADASIAEAGKWLREKLGD
jgi:epsilon-lactone hydrolase